MWCSDRHSCRKRYHTRSGYRSGILDCQCCVFCEKNKIKQCILHIQVQGAEPNDIYWLSNGVWKLGYDPEFVGTCKQWVECICVWDRWQRIDRKRHYNLDLWCQSSHRSIWKLQTDINCSPTDFFLPHCVLMNQDHIASHLCRWLCLPDDEYDFV